MLEDCSAALSNQDPRCQYSAFQKTSCNWEEAIRSPSIKKNRIIDDIEYTESLEEVRLPEPDDPFIPSSKLSRLLNRHIFLPDDEEVHSFNTMRKFYDKPPINKYEIHNLSNIISLEVEDFFTDWACHIADSEESNFITKDQQFTYDVCMVLMDRLQLDPRNPGPVFVSLCNELFDFIGKLDRERSWGKLTIEDFEISLDVKEGVFDIPDFQSIAEDRWI